jgi:hypothetical protein
VSQIIKTSSGGGGGSVNSVTGTHGVTASPTTGNVVVSGVNATTSSVGVSSFLSTDFNVSGAGQVSLLNPMRIIKSNNVDMTVGTAQAFFTSPAATFVPSQIIFYSVDITGWSSPSQFNIGWTAPNYTDLVLHNNDAFIGTTATGPFYYVATYTFDSFESFVIPPSTNVFLLANVTGSATTYIERAYILGFYLF